MDVTNEDQVNKKIHSVANKFGRLDYVVNAAGITLLHEQGAAYAPTAGWQKVLDTDQTRTFLVPRASARIMLGQEAARSSLDGCELPRGSIVHVGSIMSVVGKPMSTGYVASKHGVLWLTRTAEEDYAANGLRTHIICPGYVQTPMLDAVTSKTAQEVVEHRVPMKWLGTPGEIADSLLFLSRRRSSFIKGIALCVDGGHTKR